MGLQRTSIVLIDHQQHVCSDLNDCTAFGSRRRRTRGGLGRTWPLCQRMGGRTRGRDRREGRERRNQARQRQRANALRREMRMLLR